jgi:uncharacterized YccA/Bax inhibitor family protein
MASANPAMSPAVYDRAGFSDSTSGVMTLPGTAFKSLVLVGIVLVTGTLNWMQAANGEKELVLGLTIAGSLGGFVLALVTIFYPKIAPITAPIYAAAEGLFLGGVSSFFEKQYAGIVFQAVSLSVGILTIMLFLYATRMVQATQKFKIAVVSATGAICLVYAAGWILSWFNVRIPYIHESGMIGIGFSLFVVGVAALNLILDFDFIEQGVQQQAPKYMEWYGGFSLLVTLVWMYLEILRLLAKISNSRD